MIEPAWKAPPDECVILIRCIREVEVRVGNFQFLPGHTYWMSHAALAKLRSQMERTARLWNFREDSWVKLNESLRIVDKTKQRELMRAWSRRKEKMGSSPSAELAWGFEIDPYNENNPSWMDGESDEQKAHPQDSLSWDDIYSMRKGLYYVGYSEPYDAEATRVWREQKKQLIERGDGHVEINSEETGPSFVCVKSSYVTSCWEQLKTLDLAHLAGMPVEEMEQKLRAFCEVMGIPWKEPRWFLTATYS